jgi:glycosyltransferase involved in cell wall biosynthesis
MRDTGSIPSVSDGLFPAGSGTVNGRRLRIAYLCDQDPTDPYLYSGGNIRIFQALQTHVGDVEPLPFDWGPVDFLRRRIEAMPEALAIRLRWRLHLLLAPLINSRHARALRRDGYDVLFAAYGFHALSRLRTPRGMLRVFTSDATPTIYKDSEIGAAFGSYLRLSRLFDPFVQRRERSVFNRCDLLLWPTDWLRSGVEATFGTRPERARVIPWGANVADPGPDVEPPTLREEGKVRLLLIGRNWQAKGGPTALAVMRDLRARGVNASLTVIGCVPDEGQDDPNMTVHPNLDKTIPEHLAIFTRALRRAHFKVMPSFESYGFAFCEASAFGLPSLCLRVGGVPVRDGINGFALPPEAQPGDFSDIILRFLGDAEAYDRLRASTRQEYEDHLNWDAWGRAVARELYAAIAARQ